MSTMQWGEFRRGRRPAACAVLAVLAASGAAVASAAQPLPEPVVVGGSPGSVSSGRVQVWVDLTVLPLASAHAVFPGSRAALAHLVDRQQSALTQQLEELGAVEVGRVRIVRNAIAIEVDASQLNRIRALPGVRSVSLVRHAEVHVQPPATR